jgi:ABC-type transport system substrate-binding protein
MQEPDGDFDPQTHWNRDTSATWEFDRCCLLRTLLSFNGRSTAAGGGVLEPDLAAAPPTVSRDGLTWTFRLRRGIHYAPPFQRTEIQAQDFIRAVEREARLPQGSAFLGQGPALFAVIEGFDDFATGRSASISGLDPIDPYTLAVHLTQPTGDLGSRFALPVTAPIPPSPRDGDALLGAADGHDFDYGRFLVASGPYMFAGSESVDFSKPTTEQIPAWGFNPGVSFTLVRNPSWHAATDPLRRAYPDRIEVSLVGKPPPVGKFDLVLDESPTSSELRSASALGLEVARAQFDKIEYLGLKLGIPPLDDVHVRRAINYAIDKQRIRPTLGGRFLGSAVGPTEIAGHLLPDGVENGLLLDYDYFRTAQEGPNPAAARAEIAKSRYDTDHDGVCDAQPCRHVLLTYGGNSGAIAAARAVRSALRPLGIGVDLYVLTDQTFALLPKLGAAMSFETAATTYTDASTLVLPTFGGASFDVLSQGTNPNFALLGATPEQLRKWGYPVRKVPSLDPKIEECLARVGTARAACWAETDEDLMERIVPAVPLVFDESVEILSRRVGAYSIDQFTTVPALDRMALIQSEETPLKRPSTRTCPASPARPGTYTARIRTSDVPSFAAPVAGDWTWQVLPPDANCAYGSVFIQKIGGQTAFGVFHTFTVAPDGRTVVFRGGTQGPEYPGTYRLLARSDSVVFKTVSDVGHGGLREFVFVAKPWMRQP